MNENKVKTAIFDLDGTLYSFKSGSYENSDLRKFIMANAVLYIQNKLKISNDEAQKVLDNTIRNYKEEISIGLEKEFGFDRYEYFNTVWNIDPKNVIVSSKDLRENLLEVKKNYEIFLLSDAPQIWIENVLNYLDIFDLFEGKIISGEGDVRKTYNNAFETIIAKYDLEKEKCVVVGDQERTDIIPAKEIGVKTIFINQKEKSNYADFSFKNITQALQALNSGKIF